MEINYYENIMGGLATQDMVEGRMVYLTSHTWNKDFGSAVDLPGCALATGQTNYSKSRYCVSFAVDNRELPFYQATPSFAFALRQGFEQAANVPFAATVYLDHPGNMLDRTIPSGNGVLLFGSDSIITITSGNYTYAAAIETPGCPLEVGTGGVLAVSANYDADKVVAETVRYYSASGNLTFRIK